MIDDINSTLVDSLYCGLGRQILFEIFTESRMLQAILDIFGGAQRTIVTEMINQPLSNCLVV